MWAKSAGVNVLLLITTQLSYHRFLTDSLCTSRQPARAYLVIIVQLTYHGGWKMNRI